MPATDQLDQLSLAQTCDVRYGVAPTFASSYRSRGDKVGATQVRQRGTVLFYHPLFGTAHATLRNSTLRTSSCRV